MPLILKKKIEKCEEKARTSKYPLNILAGHAGRIIEVHYLNQGVSKIEKAVLKFAPSGDSFYIGNSTGYHIVHWDKTDANNKRDIVRLILDEKGEKLYENNLVPFDYFIKEKIKEETK